MAKILEMLEKHSKNLDAKIPESTTTTTDATKIPESSEINQRSQILDSIKQEWQPMETTVTSKAKSIE